jgi:PAS domain S-box-containing protein
MLTAIVRVLSTALLGTALGLSGALLLGEPFDAASLRSWTFPIVGAAAGVGSALGLMFYLRREWDAEVSAVAAALAEKRSRSSTDDTMREAGISRDTLTRQLAQQLERKTAKVATLRARLAHNSRDLERLKRSYRDLYHNAPVMYFGLDPDGRFVTFNDTLLNTLGYKREDLLGKLYAAVIPAHAPAESGQPLFPQNPGQPEGQKTQWRHKNGSLVDVWIRSTATMDDQGAFARWRCSALDLTERNRLADQLRAHGAELEKTNSRLRQINTELEDFTHVVSHDLKEPLRTLQAYSHILAEEYAAQLGADGFQYINHLIQASVRLGRLVDDLLDLSQAGRINRDVKTFNLNETLATVRRDLADLIQRKNATLVIEGSLPDIVGDPRRVAQLLANLIANGLKYNQNPAPRIDVGQAHFPVADADHAGRVVCFVRDNGIGIDSKFHEQIFGIFRRLHNYEEYEGTGAGLAICKKIVESHDGKIWLESQPGEGATFFFTLPKSSDQVDENAEDETLLPQPVAGPMASFRTNASLRGTRILLVEDMYEIGTLIQKLGQRSGLVFTWFTTAEEAWDYLQTTMPDFILLDKNLPGMDGLELCRRIRNTLQSQVTIALFSHEQRLEDLKSLRKAGANFFISKELLSRPAVWQEKLRELLLKARAKALNNEDGKVATDRTAAGREHAEPMTDLAIGH